MLATLKGENFKLFALTGREFWVPAANTASIRHMHTLSTRRDNSHTTVSGHDEFPRTRLPHDIS
jgi:hypothetical protein